MRKPELLIPASSLEVLKTAVMFGADAVYIGGETFSLRAKAKNFSPEDMKEGIEFAHAHGVRVHVTANILAHNYDMEAAVKYFRELSEMKPDAIIVADPGMVMLAKENCPEIEIHLSTQANNTNYMTYRFWYNQGIKRVVSARELSLKEIKEIRANIPEDMEIESFIHGAMCISYSGRCLLSNYFTGRDANRGACTHPCRWKYTVYEGSGASKENAQESQSCEDTANPSCEHEMSYYVEEMERPGVYLPVYENERGTYIFNSKDLCMIEHIPEMMDAGIDSYKIEGRMKTALYVATVARTYRKAIDAALEGPEAYEKILPWAREEISKCTYRQFTTGFYFGRPDENTQIYDSNTYEQEYVYLGIVREAQEVMLEDGSRGSQMQIEQRNKFSVGETIEIMKPDGTNEKVTVISIVNEKGENQESAPHPQQKLTVTLSGVAKDYDILRRKSE